ncbi:MAG: hypothetical protein ABI333_24595 [bacterium]
MPERLNSGATPPDPLAQGSRMARELAERLVENGYGVARLGALLEQLEEADREVQELETEVHLREVRRNDIAVRVGESMVSLRNAVASLTDHRRELVAASIASVQELEDLDFQIQELERRLVEVKAGLDSENRVVDGELEPLAGRLVSARNVRNGVGKKLIAALSDAKPDPCPEEFQKEYYALKLFRQTLPR